MPVARRLSPGLAIFCLLTSAALAAPRSDRCVILVSVDGLAHLLRGPACRHADLAAIGRRGAPDRRHALLVPHRHLAQPHDARHRRSAGRARRDRQQLHRSGHRQIRGADFDPVFDKDQIVKVPTIYDAAHDAGLKTVGIVWPATRNARSLDLTVPDMFGDGWTRYGTQSWLAEMAEGLPVDEQSPWCKLPTGGVQRDWLYTRMARQAIQKHAPNLVLIHLVETDHVEHRAGPRSDDAYWAVSYADDRIRDLVDAVEHSPLRGKTTIFICSDHGFFPITKDIRANVVLAQLGLLDKAKGGKRTAFVLSQGGAAAVYILDDAAPRRDRTKVARPTRASRRHRSGD